MGRVLKQVPLNFKWEIGKLWSGYINPHDSHECAKCEGLGWSREFKLLENEWYCFENAQYLPNPFRKTSRYNINAWSNNLTQEDVQALIDADRLWDFTRVALNDEHRAIIHKEIENGKNSWLPFNNGYIPTAKEVNDWNLKGFGHDSLNCSIVIKAKLEKNNLSYLCDICDGEGHDWKDEASKNRYENWEDYNPPVGDGFQLWTTTTEGHPMTPVFKSLELLCQFCEDENISVFGKSTTTKEKWMNMLKGDVVIFEDGNNIFI